MYGGITQKVKFKYFGKNVEAILDRLRTARVISQDSNHYLISAEVFGKGIEMWFPSQGDNVEVMKIF